MTPQTNNTWRKLRSSALFDNKGITTRISPGEFLDDDYGSKVYLSEVIVTPRSNLIGQTLSQSGLQRKFDFDVLELIRNKVHLPQPLADKVLEDFKANTPNKVLADVKIDANISGTGGGFRKFCAGETDINNASRPISVEELKECDANKVRFIETK